MTARQPAAAALLASAAAAALAPPAHAQDSISALGTGLPGDAPDPFVAADRRSDYAVDLVPFTTRGFGTEFALAPILKAPRTAEGAFNALPAASTISQDTLVGVPLGGVFALWTQAGGGVDANNDPALSTAISPAGLGSQQAVALAAFSGRTDTVQTAVITADPAAPTRLYVRRVLAAVNRASLASGDTAQLGLGGVDAHGNTAFRADGFGATGPAGSIVDGNSVLRVDALARNPGDANTIARAAGVTAGTDAAATDVPVNAFTDAAIITPTALPESLFGGPRGGVAAPDFLSRLLSGSAAPLAATGAHLDFAGAPDAGGHRGQLAFSPRTPLGGVATLAVAAQGDVSASGPGPGATRTVNAFAVDAAGTPIARVLFTPGPSVTDPRDGTTIGLTGAVALSHIGGGSFTGGGGAAVHADALGRLLAAQTLQTGNDADGPDSAIIAYRTADAGDTVERTVVAYTGPGLGLPAGRAGRAIAGGPAGQRIGELVPLATTAAAAGPSLSGPAFDSAGNVWFTAGFTLDAEQTAEPGPEGARVGLFRAVYDPDAFAYDLELVLAVGDSFTGANAATPYAITRVRIAQERGDASPAALNPGSVSKAAAFGADGSALEPADPRTNGGLVVACEITYDADGDGDFNDPTGANTDAESTDEAYTVLIYVGPTRPVVDADADGNGAVNNADLFAFAAAFNAQAAAADADGNGRVDADDLTAFITEFAAAVGP